MLWPQRQRTLMGAGVMTRTGGCLCGEIRYEVQGEPDVVVTCHCHWCQRVSGAPFLTFVGFEPSSVRWLKSEPTIYKSSEMVDRGFCPTCGSTLTFARPAKNVMALMSGSLDDPDSISPESHCFTEHQNAWLSLSDGLPTHQRYPPGWEDREPK